MLFWGEVNGIEEKFINWLAKLSEQVEVNSTTFSSISSLSLAIFTQSQEQRQEHQVNFTDVLLKCKSLQ